MISIDLSAANKQIRKIESEKILVSISSYPLHIFWCPCVRKKESPAKHFEMDGIESTVNDSFEVSPEDLESAVSIEVESDALFETMDRFSQIQDDLDETIESLDADAEIGNETELLWDVLNDHLVFMRRLLFETYNYIDAVNVDMQEAPEQQGLNQKQIDAIPLFTISQQHLAEDLPCSICLESFELDQHANKLNCKVSNNDITERVA